MSQAETEALHAFYEAFNRGDWDYFFRAAHPDLEFIPPEQVTLNPGTHRGPKEVRRFLEDLFEPFEEVAVEAEEFLERSDRIMVSLLWRARPMGSSAVLENRVAHLWTMRDGKPARCESFENPEKAVKALDLLEQDACADSS